MSKRILLVDDDEMIIDSLQRLLIKKGYEVTVANNGHEAVELNKSQDFDLIITDIRMPRLDGISTIKIIRSMMDEKKQNRVPEILLTGYATEEHMLEAQHLKVADCLYKPVDIWELLKSIKKAIG